MNRVIQFIKESFYELKKASWLGRKEAVQSTWAVVVLVAIFSLYVASIDFVLSKILGIILGG